MIPLSVVIITKNQAWNITRLVESVLRETASISNSEIILVDSASQDDTVKLACEFPINVVQLQPDQQLTASAGRYIGYKRTTGELMLFLDGDMELCEGWLSRALDLLDRAPEIAVISGMVVDAAPDNPEKSLPLATGTLRDIRFCGGAGMFRRAVLRQVGPYNPYLYSDEEPELCLRIRRAGYRVVQIGYPMAKHYSPYEHALSTLIARWHRNLYLGGGQIIRYHLGTRTMAAYLGERGFVLITGPWAMAGLACSAVLAFGGSARWFATWGVLSALVVAGNAVLKRSLRRSIASVVKQSLILAGTVKGLLFSPRPPESYPGKLRVVRHAPARSYVA